jgi:hypothetical protein
VDRIDDPDDNVQQLPDLKKIAERRPDDTLQIPAGIPTTIPHNTQYRFSDTTVYPALETNIDANAMAFSQEPFPEARTSTNIEKHGKDSPFRHWKVVEGYIQNLVNRRRYDQLVSYNTTVEHVSKNPESQKWTLTLRQPVNDGQDQWWQEAFDSVVVASGHYHVPFIPHTPGLDELAANFPGILQHSKAYRKPETYWKKRVIVVGASISGPDISFTLADFAESPVHSVVRGRYHPYFFDYAFQHPNIQRHPAISQITSSRAENTRTVYFEDGTKIEDFDYIIFATGYSWTLPFLPEIAKTIRNNRLPNLYQHIFLRGEPSLCFVGAIAAGFTFKVFEWQAVLVARYLAGRITLPPVSEQIKWEEDRIAYKGDGVPFTALYPDFEEYFEEVRKLAGEPINGKGRPLPKFEKKWREDFDKAHLKRIAMWKRVNEAARKRIESENGILYGEPPPVRA